MADFKICERVKGNLSDYRENGPINIIVMGDSISHGCFADGERDYEAVYHNRLHHMINRKHPEIPVNVINAAIGGTGAKTALSHFERDIAHHRADLAIICFGLNDVNGDIDEYAESLGAIFDKCHEGGTDCVFMTPNMLNTYVTGIPSGKYYDYAENTAKMQNEGRMDAFMEEARKICSEKGVSVCDAYAKWKEMAASGIDTTALLCNYINHPTKEMHKLFSDMLYETIFREPFEGKSADAGDGMINL